MKKYFPALTATLTFATILFSFSSESYAQAIIEGKGPQQVCYESALYGKQGTKYTINACTEGLDAALSRKDRAATYVNRGILHMRNTKFERARKDYEAAIKTYPDLPEAYMNYGAVLIQLDDYDGALKALNKAIDELPPKHLHQALFNRAIIYDSQEKYRDAYLDLKRALELRPDWDDALKSIKRYLVAPKNSG
ncbi:MAG: tetratricopeptide repeat protein [Litorimonas sp.]